MSNFKINGDVLYERLKKLRSQNIMTAHLVDYVFIECDGEKVSVNMLETFNFLPLCKKPSCWFYSTNPRNPVEATASKEHKNTIHWHDEDDNALYLFNYSDGSLVLGIKTKKLYLDGTRLPAVIEHFQEIYLGDNVASVIGLLLMAEVYRDWVIHFWNQHKKHPKPQCLGIM